jgi:signal transduction histidine kinase
MFGWLSHMWALHWGCTAAVLGLVGVVSLLRHQERIHVAERRRDKRIREEFEAYARFDARLHGDDEDEDVRELAKRVCRLVAKKSTFQRIAIMAKDAEGPLYVAGSIGMEEMMIDALHAWGEHATKQADQPAENEDPPKIRVYQKSFAVVLGKESVGEGCGRAIMVPLWAADGQMLGALAVCADRLMTLRHQTVEETIAPLESLAVKLARAIESAALAKRLQRAEKLAGLGLLATGVAKALNTPLTTVLGFAELIQETSREARVQADAQTIVNEARRMQQTVHDLLNFGLAEPRIDEPVEIPALIYELAAECEEKLESRGVRLIVEVDDVPIVRGSGERLRQVLEHLLNNAAQAIASVNDDADTEHEIRMAVSQDANSVQLLVSDTGPGFKEPERVFDPFHPARQLEEGVGVGLSICYGIVREHGGEISAFNLHPYGAAVVIELPWRKSVGQELSDIVREVA